MQTNGERGWKVYKGDVLIGTAYFRFADQPWLVCEFVPEQSFETYKPLFDEMARLTDAHFSEPGYVDPLEYHYENIESLNLQLVPFGDVWQGNIFIAQIHDGNEAWLRPL